MTAALHPTFAEADQFTVFDPEDRLNASVCIGRAETQSVVRQFNRPSIVVLRTTLDEMVRDVTDEFLPEQSLHTALRPRRLSSARMDNWSVGDWIWTGGRR